MTRPIPLYKAHPWHGVSIGPDAPSIVQAYIEMVPTDVVKYEIDKASGHLKVDRPQKFSSQCPALYGFLPRTYCGEKIGELCAKETGRSAIEGDGDPLDICVFSERPIAHGDILLKAIPIGGLRMIDGNQADDKILAVLFDDPVYGGWKTVGDCPDILISRLRHYFLTYKNIPGHPVSKKVEITDVYNADVARRVIETSQRDYETAFPSPA